MVDRRKLFASIVVGVLTVAVFVGVVVVVGRVSETATFVTWPIVGFTVLAAATAVVGAWFGRTRPAALAVGVLAALPISYVLPAAPVAGVAVVLVGLGGLAVTVRGAAAGLATGVGGLMVLLVVLQGPAVECGESSVSSNSGPWWIESSGSSTGSSSMTPEGVGRGTTQVGDRHYEYTCDDGRLTGFRAVG